MQKENLSHWKIMLKKSLYYLIKEALRVENKKITDDDGYKIIRGESLDFFIKNHAKILNKET